MPGGSHKRRQVTTFGPMPVSGHSYTAAFIALKFHGLLLEEAYRSLFDRDTADHYRALAGRLPPPCPLLARLLERPALRSLAARTDEFLLRGDLMHILLRKKALEDRIGRMAEQGFSQLIILGAGYDHQAARWAQRGLPSIEIDAPAVASFKRDFLSGRSGPAGKQPEILDGPLTLRSVHDLLQESHTYDPRRKTILAAEGFFDYLESHAARHLLEQFRHVHRAEMSLLTTVFSLGELQPLHRFFFRTGVRLSGERLKLRQSLPEFRRLIAKSGWETENVWTGEMLKREFLHPNGIQEPVMRGFSLLRTAAN